MSAKPKEVPLWQVGRKGRKPPQGPSVSMEGRKGRKLQRELLAAAKAQRAAAEKDAGIDPQQGMVARTGGWRFRRHLVPFIWIAAMASGLALHALHVRYGWLAGLVLAGTATLAAMGLKDFPGQHVLAAGLFSGAWTSAFATWGLMKPASAIALIGWLIEAGLWTDYYRVRFTDPPPEPTESDAERKFAELAQVRNWAARLWPGMPISGGHIYPIACRGSKTTINDVMADPVRLAATFESTLTQVYATDDPRGRKHMGLLYVLDKATLEDIRPWDGKGIDRTTGLARVGRFPDGSDVHERTLGLPKNGTKLTIVAGADGSGKTGMLHLGIAQSAVSGFVAPVILDPQQGQALLEWRGHVPYAVGLDECMTYLRGLHAAMFDRSDYLANVRWCSSHGVFLHQCSPSCRVRTGMGFFNPFLAGLPVARPASGCGWPPRSPRSTRWSRASCARCWSAVTSSACGRVTR
jgi:hypothetical protein